MLLDTAYPRQRELQITIHARIRVAEAQRFRLNAIHEDDAHPREGVVIEFAIRRLDQLPPGEALLFQGHTRVLQ
jgi:hypothetical protein